MKVSLDMLKRVYISLQEQTERVENGMEDMLDPEDHLFFVDAYDMPRWVWSQERITFEK